MKLITLGIVVVSVLLMGEKCPEEKTNVVITKIEDAGKVEDASKKVEDAGKKEEKIKKAGPITIKEVIGEAIKVKGEITKTKASGTVNHKPKSKSKTK